MSRADILRLAAEAQVDPRTVIRLLSAQKVRPAMRDRVLEAAKKLRIKMT